MEEKELIELREGAVRFCVHESDEKSIPSKAMDVFYNKKMALNRYISTLAINAYSKLHDKKNLFVIDSMAASGIGALRLLKECENISKMIINDINPAAVELIHENLTLNDLEKTAPEIIVSRKDANFLFSEISQRFFIKERPLEKRPDVISIDPFGTPNLYVDSAFKAVHNDGALICITATDTAVLFGVRKQACMRKYMAKPLHNEFTKETGARILVQFLARIANVNKIGLKPLFTFYSNHFIRCFLLTYKNRNKIADSFKNHGYLIWCRKCGYRNIHENDPTKVPNACSACGSSNSLDHAGPLWIGELHDEAFLTEIIRLNAMNSLKSAAKCEKPLNYALEEIGMPISYHNLHKLCKSLKLERIPRMEDVISAIREQGFMASRTHFDFLCVKTDMDRESLKQILITLMRDG